jgi:hypothetical protein
MNLVTPNVAAKHELLFNRPSLEAHFVELPSLTYVTEQIVTRFKVMTVMYLVTTKAAAKHEL